MRWLLRLYSLKRPSDGKSFLLWFARYMWRITEGVARDIWYQTILWVKMPEFVVDASIEVAKFVSRPFAVEFLHIMHRHFHFATMSTRSGMTLSSKLFGPYPLVFVSEDTVYEQLQDRPWIDDQNSFILGVCDDDDNECDMIPHRMTVSTYTKQNCNDDVLGPHTDLLKFLLSVSDKSNMGIHIDQHNE